MPQRLPFPWLCALPALAFLTANAQENTPPAAPVSESNIPAAAPTDRTRLPYQSAFDGYQPFTDAKVRPWKQTNATVEAAGGWRAYAKEAAEPVAKDPQAPATATPASAPAAKPYADHGKH